MSGRDTALLFEQLVLPHLDSAHNLARWLTGSANTAEDVVQEACLRALRSFDTFRGPDARAWFLRIVRNTSYTWLRRNRGAALSMQFDEEIHSGFAERETPEAAALRSVDGAAVRQAIEDLPPEYREVIVLREVEEMDYRSIAAVLDIPLGTVMSRLYRARECLRQSLAPAERKGGAAV